MDTTTKERPIIMTAESVRGILTGTKSQTRRVIKPQPHQRESGYWWFGRNCFASNETLLGELMEGYCPYGSPGDRLWCRETFTGDWRGNGQPARGCINYRADGKIPDKYREGNYWRPSIFMPRWASRITLEVVSVRVERVQSISDDDAIEEGVDRTNTSIPTYAIQRYRKLWDSINGAKPGCSWVDNPYVWCVAFRRLAP